MFRLTLRLFLILVPGFSALAADELQSTLADQQNISVTIYNENLALVKDLRRIRLESGLNALAFRDVSAQIRPETALLRSLSPVAALTVMEQNFDFDLLTPQKLLEKYVGKTVSVIKSNPSTGEEKIELAQVLSATNGVVLKVGDRIETGIPGRIVYHDIPGNLRERPTLAMLLNSNTALPQEVELSYLTGGLGWKADYVAELNAADDRLDLSAWVTLTNTSGTSYRNAKLQLIAGDVNRVHEEIRPTARLAKMEMSMAAESPNMAEESLLEYHQYSLERPTTIADNQTKQVALLNAANVPTHKEFLLKGSDYYYQASTADAVLKVKIGVFVDFDNKENAHLGMPLPKGVIRVYKRNSNGNAQFVGEDRIEHTARNDNIRLKLGDAFDITAERKQTDFKKPPNQPKGSTLIESAHEIVIKNAKKEPVTVTVQEPIPSDWKMLKSSHTFVKATSNSAIWHISIPAESNTSLTYRVQVRY